MYGSPTADFRLNATVVDNATKDPIKGILVEVTATEGFYSQSDLSRTNGSGSFTTSMQVAPMDQKIKVIWQDIDGADNGNYAKDSLEFEIKREDFKGGDGSWYYGAQTKEMEIEIEKAE